MKNKTKFGILGTLVRKKSDILQLSAQRYELISSKLNNLKQQH